MDDDSTSTHSTCSLCPDVTVRKFVEVAEKGFARWYGNLLNGQPRTIYQQLVFVIFVVYFSSVNIDFLVSGIVQSMGGNQSSRRGGGIQAKGTDFKTIERERRRKHGTDDGADDDTDIPPIPYMKQKKIADELERSVRHSLWMCNYKRAFRGYLRRNPERAQIGTELRLHDNSMVCADELGLYPEHSFGRLIETLVDEVGVIWYDDALEFMREKRLVDPERDGLQKERERVNDAIAEVFRQMANDYITVTGKKLYEKYSKGADFEISDTDAEDERRKREAQQKQEAIRREAEERERQAQQWKREAELEMIVHEKRQQDVEKHRVETKKIQQSQGLL